jgi:hypothetical protein
VNWTGIKAMSEGGVNWSDFNVMSKAGINWSDLDVLSKAGVNWSDLNVLSKAGVNWSDLDVMTKAGVNWADMCLSKAGVNWNGIKRSLKGSELGDLNVLKVVSLADICSLVLRRRYRRIRMFSRKPANWPIGWFGAGGTGDGGMGSGYELNGIKALEGE